MTIYVYDAGGQRVRKLIERQNGSRKAERIYLGGFEIYREFDGGGIDIALERETLHIMDDKQRIAVVEIKTLGNDGSLAQLVRYQFDNHLGSAGLELDDTATPISYEEYFPYGNTSYQAVDQSIKAAKKRYRYTGKERDEETGFSYHSARYYAGWLGRWTSYDPAGVSDGVNLYAYVSNNPICKFDDNGKRGLIYQMHEQQRNAGKRDIELLTQEEKKVVRQSIEPPPLPLIGPPAPPALDVKPVPSTSDIPTPDSRKPPFPAKAPNSTTKDPSLTIVQQRPDPNSDAYTAAREAAPTVAPSLDSPISVPAADVPPGTPPKSPPIDGAEVASQLSDRLKPLDELKDKGSKQTEKALDDFGYKDAGDVGKILIVAPIVIVGATVFGTLALGGRHDDSLLGDAANSPKVYVHKIKSFGPFSDIRIKIKLTAPNSQPSTPAVSDKPAPNEKERVNSLTIGGSF
jgi:RHS repeat-associated protein